jgi:excisionase family DNA binding protein
VEAPSAAPADNSAPDLLTIPEAARRLRREPDSLYRLVRAGKFAPAVKVGGRWLVSVRKLERIVHGEGGGGDAP